MSRPRFRERLAGAASRIWSALPFGVRTRAIHALNPSFLVGVVGIVHDGDGRVLLLEHRFRPPYPWGLPGGYLKRGETLEEGLRRELREEIDLEVDIEPEPFDVELHVPGAYVSVTLVARARTAPRIISSEILTHAKVGVDDIPASTYPHHAALIRRYLAPALHLGSPRA